MKKTKTSFRGLTYLLSVVLSTCLIVNFPPPSVFAQESTPSADLQLKIDQLKAEIASKAAAIKKKINQKLQNKILAGLVQSAVDGQILLAADDRNGKVLTNQYTDYQYQGKLTKKISQDDYIIALGDINDKGEVVARRIVKTTPPKNTPLVIFWGKVTDASASGFNARTTDNNLKGVNLDKKTNILLGNQPGKVENLESQRAVIVSGFEQSGIVQARFVYIFPNLKPKPKIASPSGLASKSASPKKIILN